MLSLLLLLSSLGRLSSASPETEASLLQITVPQKIETDTRDGKDSETHVSYLIKTEGKTYTLLLEKQSFLHQNFLVYSYNKSGTLEKESSFIEGHCFYQGHAREIPRSVVTLSTCSGLRGLLQLENVSYGIEPLESSATYEHMLYEIKNNNTDFSPLKDNYLTSQHADQPHRILVKPEKNSDVAPMRRMLKIQIIMDKAMYDYMGSEVRVAVQKVIHIFGLINTMFSQLKMTIMLSSLEIWSDKNKISTDGDADEVLQRFLSWKQNNFLQRSNDVAYLLLYKDNPDYVGATYHGMACDPKFGAGIALHPKTITLEAFSVVIAQLLGINMGLTYDEIYNCYCPGSACIMNPEAIHSGGIKIFSSCSMEEYKQIISQPEFECLQNKTISKVILQPKASSCGNGRVEKPEQCDCGMPEECTHKKCCNPLDCNLIPPAECGTGKCCNNKTCLIAERGKLCRKSKDLCDFPEYCNGTSEYCVPDVKSADLELCNNKSALCFQGICRDLDRQCTDIFGKYAKGPNYLCSEEVNFHHDKFGNCGDRCKFDSVHCGKLVCNWMHSELADLPDHDLQYTYLQGHVCLSAHLRVSAKKDRTYVYDGTMCGQNKFCHQKRCKDVITYPDKASCNSKVKCQGHGVCNDRHNCHCDPGYSPPNCDVTPSSPGGSMDDGFWIPVDKSTPLVVKVPRRTVPHINRLLISFYVFIPLLILTVITVLNWKKMKRFWHKAGTVSGESIPDNSSNNSTQSLSERDDGTK